MTWTQDLERTRYWLRDPDGNVWSEAFLRHLYNDVQQDFQNRTQVLEEVVAHRVPGMYICAYVHDWEYAFTPGRAYQALTQHSQFSICYPWESQEITGLASDATDQGHHFTQPWEGYMALPAEPIRFRFPSNFGTMLWAAYDEDPLFETSKKIVQSKDSSYVTHEGTPVAYYPWDQDSYVLYPRPSTGFYNEVDGTSGAALYADDDSEDVTTGNVAVRSTSYDGSDGVTVDIVDTTNNLFCVYRASPRDVNNADVESAFPAFLRKYVIFGVVARAYSANTDGRIRSLGELWASRYELGISFTKRYMRTHRRDRDYRALAGPTARKIGRPRLPDTFPAV